METPVNKFPNSLIWITGIAIILFCATGIAAIMGWIPTSMGHGSDDTTLTSAERFPTDVIRPAKANARIALDSPLAPMASSNEVPVHRRCAECGVIVSTRQIESSGEASGIGAIGGGLLGGVLGHQVGGGRGQDLAAVVGAVGGVVAGNEIEKRMKSTQGYNVMVRLHDGSSRVIHEVNPPMWRNGDYVKIVDGVIHSN
ncbi:MAG: glycine zipper 2TM domain-containing protein [Proteobacteria bacterium]|nr:glycine zipper 2TM domain-containing protein [Pseudomonadota bacterium]